MPTDTTPLPLTGERTVPGIVQENYWFRRHEVAYLHLVGHCADAVVLEAGCGEGYGADLLAGAARHVIALDYDAQTAAHVARAYPAVSAVRGNLAGLPLRDGAVDVVANLQVIEHLWDQEGFLAECRRVLRPGGVLLVTTPNRITFSPGATPRSTRSTPANWRARSCAGCCSTPGSPSSSSAACTTAPGWRSWTRGSAGRSSTRRWRSRWRARSGPRS
ncbi:class I SAM-dependent methyltransferase [Actinokineospora soli]|uniref:Class I SAM-dependent methyltransferase n=1 Tax=Actinokineospora soli TaxID=1048753 RepID=A0ABW2TT81_9PSEU